MSKVYVLASLSNQGKTTTAIALEKHFKNEGLKVACIQRIKGQYDVGLYLRENIYQYNMPLEAAKSRDAFEKWLPKGYDVFIFELWHPYTPTGAAFADLFERINVPMSYQFSDSWKTYVESCHPDFMLFWDNIHQKEVTKVITKTPACLDGPCVDEQYQLHMPENFGFDTFEPRMTLPKSDKTAIAAGAFPGEYWDIFPSMTWYGYDYHKFMKRVKKEDCDVVIIGECSNRHLKLNYYSRTARTLCYQPSVYLDCQLINEIGQANTDPLAVYRTIKEKPVGTPLGNDNSPYAPYNNKFWAFQQYADSDIIRREENAIYCNGWILPQYLIRDGHLEV
ncbi:MAG: hypothetical protein PWR21_27 [Methanoculleus sp.]|jgi:hypothetical protein|uniref:hypothetical protein n=1 Tax=Methanoculleus sp. TaxID=90427 RepID=UPI001BD482DA|nr:hypothetical protein [Methanoculleus sp.]MDK2889396.1 hypothetical protein [Methanoculleus sp.]